MLAAALVAAALATSALCRTSAAGDPAEEQRALLERAADAERDEHFAQAEELYERARDALPASRLARHARTRLEWLASHAEEDFGPLAQLAAARAAEADLGRLDAFAEEVERFPPGLVRREALGFLADTFLRRLGEPARALAAYRRLASLDDVSEGERQLALSGAAEAEIALGHPSDAVSLLDAADLARRPERAHARAEAWRRTGEPIALALLAVYAAATLALAARHARGAAALAALFAPRRLALVLYAFGVPLVLMQIYDDTYGYRLAVVLGAAGLVVALAALGAAGANARGWGTRRRALFALASSLAAGCAAFVAVVRTGWLFRLFVAWGERR